MSPSLKAVLALVFVAVMGAVLIQPILNSGDVAAISATDDPSPDESKRTKPSPTEVAEETPEPSPEPTPEPTPSAEGGLISGPFRTQPLFDRYPRSCLKTDPQVGEGRGIALLQPGGRLTFGSDAGADDPPLTVDAKELFGFNATGALYAGASSDGGFVASAGEPPRRGKTSQQLMQIVWSPGSACGLGLSDEGQLTTDSGDSVLVQQGVKGIAFSPDGRKLAMVLVEGQTTSVWVADLSGTKMTEVHRARSGRPLSLKAWSPGGNTLYLTTGRRSGLTFVTVGNTSAPPVTGAVAPGRVTGLEHCGERLLGILDGGIAEISKRGPDPVTEVDAGYSAVACSPDAGFIAAIRNGRLELLDADGNLVRSLVTDSGYRDVYVDWGQRGAGLLVGRVLSGSNTGEIWYLPEGGAASNTGLTFKPGRAAIDWSASPPTGLSLR